MPPSVFPTGVTISDPDIAHPTSILIDTRKGHSYVIGMDGSVIHSWPKIGFPSELIDPALNGGTKGHVIVQADTDTFNNETLLELDWQGNTVWEYGKTAPGGRARQNHDIARLPNGETLMLCTVTRQVAALGGAVVEDQVLRSVDRSGRTTWEWFACDHLDELGLADRVEWLISPKMRRRASGVLNLNNLAPLGPNRWFDGGDARFHPDNMMIDSREANFAAIISRETGKVTWLLGPDYPGSYDYSKRAFVGPLPRPVDSLMGLHDAHMIEPGLPGAGNVLIFDNQGAAGAPPAYLDHFSGSRVVEIDPITQQIVWQYDGTMSNSPPWSFFSSFISSARRLPNGNTLICEGAYGRIFQVTAEGRIAWEYVSPFYGPWHFALKPGVARVTNWVFRAQPVPFDWLPVAVSPTVPRITPVHQT